MKVFDHIPHINFMKFKGVALVASWVIILFCFIWMRPWSDRDSRIRFGMQFTGGIDMLISVMGKVDKERILYVLNKGGIVNARVTAYKDRSDINKFSIKIKAEHNQNEWNSGVNIENVINILKGLDSNIFDDNKLSLNTESAESITDSLIKSNPLKLNNKSIHSEYKIIVDKIIKNRKKIDFISNYNQISNDLPVKLVAHLKENYCLGNIAVLKSEIFSPSISNEWSWKTFKAVFWSVIVILFYLFFRFTLSFSVGAIIALIHDVLMALGLFVLFGFEFSVPVVASFLILIGYSMTDTIVVFDRIRENSNKFEYKKVDMNKLVNDSINQTLSRTVLSSLSVLFIALCLLIWGGPGMRDLSFPIFIGVITGTYSSIFIASSMIIYFDEIFNKAN